MEKTFIVTGGAGFIGSNIIAALNDRGHEDILVVDRLDCDGKKNNLNSVKFHNYLDKDDFRRNFLEDKLEPFDGAPSFVPSSGTTAGRQDRPVDTVFHMGACTSTTETDEEYLTDNNFRYTRELCEWCLRHEIRFIYASSAATYGDGSLGYSDEDEITPKLNPLNLYGRSKHMFDIWALENNALQRIAGLKYFNVYGPHEDHKEDMRSVVNKAYEQILATGEVRLFKSYRPEYGDGEQERDFVYVKDAVKVTLFFHDHPEVSGLFNCGTGRPRTWIDLAKAVFAAMKKEPEVVFVDMPEELREGYQYHTQADVSKLRRAGYGNAFTPLEEGVRDYVRSYLTAQKC